MLAAQVFVWAFVIYALLGCVFAVAFVARGVQRVDSLARESTMGFRLCLLYTSELPTNREV